ncbi:MAG TPA: glycosyltransferase family 4 protein [Rhizomicrobium sp.]|jgi:glycosyltransferase involved in cell wall biosynthesis|nr:glycosyltransferase family 4 protein [Rhizomicrobium sp.]
MKEKSKPHLLHIFNTFNPGGAQTRLVALANHFGPSLRHSIVAMDGHFSCAEKFDPNLDITLIPLEVRKNTLVGNLKKFRGVLSRLDADRLITHNWGTIEWAVANWPLFVPHIHVEDGFGPDEANGQFLRRILARRLLLQKSLVVVPSLTLARIARHDWHISASRLRFVPNGVDCERFSRQNPETTSGARQPQGWQGNGAIIGTVATLRSEKNLSRLIRAFAEVLKKMPCRLVIVGDGSEIVSLKALAARLEVSNAVTFTGHINDPSPVYRQFDIFALTSDTEQMPYTVLEAMAAGCPIVATDVGDVRHMVAAPNRPFVVARDDGAVTSALFELLSNKELQRTIGNVNARHVEVAYDQRAMFRAFTELYQLRGLSS